MSIKPGQSGFVTIDPAIGTTSSDTMNPLSPVEYGRTVSGGVEDDWFPGTSPGTITLGSVTITGANSQTVGTGSTYSASINGNAADATYVWTTDDSGATISSANAASTDIQFSAAGNFTVTCTVSSATATPPSAVGTKAVEVSTIPLSIALTSSDFTNGQALPDDVGANFTGQQPTNPALSWTLTGTNVANIAAFQLRCIDTDASNYVHWSVDGIGTDVTSIAATPDQNTNNWTGTPTINPTGGGFVAFANGWEPCGPPGGETHNYVFQIQGVDSNGIMIVSSNLLTGTYTG